MLWSAMFLIPCCINVKIQNTCIYNITNRKTYITFFVFIIICTILTFTIQYIVYDYMTVLYILQIFIHTLYNTHIVSSPRLHLIQLSHSLMNGDDVFLDLQPRRSVTTACRWSTSSSCWPCLYCLAPPWLPWRVRHAP